MVGSFVFSTVFFRRIVDGVNLLLNLGALQCNSKVIKTMVS